MLIHYGLVEAFLSCNFDAAALFHIVSVSSDQNAFVLGDECDTTNDPIPPVDTECYVIASEVNMTAYFPLTQPMPDVTQNPDVLNATVDYLNSSMAKD